MTEEELIEYHSDIILQRPEIIQQSLWRKGHGKNIPLQDYDKIPLFKCIVSFPDVD